MPTGRLAQRSRAKVEGTGPGVSHPRVEALFPNSEEPYFTFLGLHLLICKMKILIIHISKSYGEFK